MICARCQFYAEPSRRSPYKCCTWRPSADVVEMLRQALPAPCASAALVPASPSANIVQCGTFSPASGELS